MGGVSQGFLSSMLRSQENTAIQMGGVLPYKLEVYCSGTKKEPKPKLLSPDIFWWGGGLPCERVGAKKFGMSLETQGIKLFWRDIPGFCRDIPEAPEKFEKKMFGFNFRFLTASTSQISCRGWGFRKIAQEKLPEFRRKRDSGEPLLTAKWPNFFPFEYKKNQHQSFQQTLQKDLPTEKPRFLRNCLSTPFRTTLKSQKCGTNCS